MKAIARFLFGMIVLSILGMAGVMLFAGAAHGQVTDKPILAMPPADAVVDLKTNPVRACAAWWERDADKFGDYHPARVFINFGELTATQRGQAQTAISARDIPALVKLRTRNVTPADTAACDAQLGATLPPPAWIVAPIASGKRPAYLLNADGTRGKQSGTADVLITDADGKTHGPQWCLCKIRSKETTSSMYCAFANSWPPLNKGDPVAVTLCRAAP